MSRAPVKKGSVPIRTGEDDDICPVCKSSRYLNQNMKFLINPECYHKMCESCVDRIFSSGPAPCPVAGCGRTLRKQRFRKQILKDIRIEREVDIRRRVNAVFNRRQEEFETLRDYNNYLEEVEILTFNLVNGSDVEETERKIAAYAAEHRSTISRNRNLAHEESVSINAEAEAQREHARLRRAEALREEEDERREREEGKRTMVERLASSKGNADAIVKEMERAQTKRSSAKGERANTERMREQARSAKDPFGTDNGSAGAGYTIKGLKKVNEPEPDQPYDAYGGVVLQREYYVLQDQYEHPWLDKAKTDPQITTGGYDVGEYCARAMFEAFSGLGCFIEDETAARDVAVESGIATTAAAMAGGSE